MGAKRAQAYLTAAGLGTKANPAKARAMLASLAKEDRFVAVQLTFLDHVGCEERVKTAPRQRVSADPHIEVVQGLFSAEECRYIQLLANPWMEPSMMYAADGSHMRDPHHDAHALAPSEKRRIATALVYLNDAYEGGETHFPEVGVTVRGAIGDMLIFQYLTAFKLPDLRMTHTGLPVTKGEKWLATRWIRGGDYFGRG